MNRRACAGLVGWGLVLVLSACAGSRPATEKSLPRVAVLPFESLSGSAENARIVTRLFQSALSRNKSVQLLDPGVVEDALATLRIRQPSLLTESERAALRSRLDFDLVVVGSVLSYGTVIHPYAGEVAIVSISARVVSGSDGTTVWADTRSRQGSDSQWLFGLGSKHDPAGLAQTICQSMVDDIRWKQ